MTYSIEQFLKYAQEEVIDGIRDNSLIRSVANDFVEITKTIEEKTEVEIAKIAEEENTKVEKTKGQIAKEEKAKVEKTKEQIAKEAKSKVEKTKEQIAKEAKSKEEEKIQVEITKKAINPEAFGLVIRTHPAITEPAPSSEKEKAKRKRLKKENAAINALSNKVKPLLATLTEHYSILLNTTENGAYVITIPYKRNDTSFLKLTNHLKGVPTQTKTNKDNISKGNATKKSGLQLISQHTQTKLERNAAACVHQILTSEDKNSENMLTQVYSDLFINGIRESNTSNLILASLNVNINESSTFMKYFKEAIDDKINKMTAASKDDLVRKAAAIIFEDIENSNLDYGPLRSLFFDIKENGLHVTTSMKLRIAISEIGHSGASLFEEFISNNLISFVVPDEDLDETVKTTAKLVTDMLKNHSAQTTGLSGLFQSLASSGINRANKFDYKIVRNGQNKFNPASVFFKFFKAELESNNSTRAPTSDIIIDMKKN